jgi:hypothetical protein
MPTPPLPKALEQILAAAARDPQLRDELLRDRLAAVRSRGFQLSPSEEAVLLAVPAEQLRELLAAMPPDVTPVPSVPTAMPVRGSLPDQPVTMSHGIRPDDPKYAVVKGIRPGLGVGVALVATGAAALGVGAFCKYTSKGHTADVPAERAPAPPALTPDGGPDGSAPPPTPKKAK